MKNKIYLDASALGEASCIKRLYLRVVRGYRHPDSSDAADFGNCVHKYMAHITVTGNKEAATLKALQEFDKLIGQLPSWRNKAKLIDICMNYPHDNFFTQFPTPIVEKYFEVPVYETENNTYYLCGTMDNISQLPSGETVIRDYKTTSSWNKVEYLADYRLSTQIHVYQTICNILADLHPDKWAFLADAQFIIDGIFIGKSKPAEYCRSEAFPAISRERSTELLNYVRSLCTRLEGQIVAEGIYNGACSSGWFKGVKGKCSFSPVCGTQLEEEMILESTYVQRKYDPREWQE